MPVDARYKKARAVSDRRSTRTRAFGADDTLLPFVLAAVFLVWLTFDKRKWPILRLRRRAWFIFVSAPLGNRASADI